ncbi:hypothetical protein Q5H93_15085 [Hymenobacter sp. ASUV-10]|uniref:DUF4252 domain-containing protein n=1 Tax=Hymenobacter aranciens TaxID=3063996 RepID=A0ABT9BCT4_9BACT|nr:hypothetical protein [Hymenobacter sp. ASUV-10]MDO7876067.1 hypothetical protein [Hymenobacter sp. ASUV-10]
MSLLKASAIILLALLIACQESQSERISSDPAKVLDEPTSQEAITSYSIDTAAILKNIRLDALLADVQSANLLPQKAVSNLPSVVNNFLHEKVEDFAIVNPEEDFQSTDIMTGNLPRRRLMYLGVADDIVLLAYELGGFGLSERVLIFKLNEHQITDFWTGSVKGKLQTKDEIVTYLRKNKNSKNKYWALNTNTIYF